MNQRMSVKLLFISIPSYSMRASNHLHRQRHVRIFRSNHKLHEMLFLEPIEPYSDSMICNIVLETNIRSYPASLRLGIHGIWVGRAFQCGV